MFTLHSTISSNELIFSSLDKEYFNIEIKGDVTASIKVWAYTDIKTLLGFFQILAKETKPWEGEKSWGSIEEDFFISATCTSLGSVAFKIKLWGHPGSSEGWKLETGIESEFGQLPKLGKRAEDFFKK